jgi:hypothetical protein
MHCAYVSSRIKQYLRQIEDEIGRLHRLPK